MNPELECERIGRLMDSAVKLRVEQLVPGYLAQTRHLADPRPTAMSLLRQNFPLAAPAQIVVLLFYLNCRAALAESVGPANASYQLDLQIVLNRQSRYFSVLSSILQTIGTTMDNIIANIK